MKAKRTCLSFVLALAVTAVTVLSPMQSVLAQGQGAGGSNIEGDGSPASPYVLDTQEDLLYITEQMNKGDGAYVGKAYELGSDISMTEDFPMIDAFTGSLDGKGHSIEGVVMKGVLPETNKCS